jgi:very-short-patch-repair endonuclease
MGGDALASLLSTALAGRLTTQQRILRALAERGRHPARALLVDMLSDVGAGAHGALEVRYVRDVERAHGLPTAVRQAHLTRRHRADGWYRDYGVLVELDGRLHHFGNSVAHDAWRDNDHALLGQVTLRYGWPAISADPCLVARQVATALAARGWLGTATCCSRCRLVPR